MENELARILTEYADPLGPYALILWVELRLMPRVKAAHTEAMAWLRAVASATNATPPGSPPPTQDNLKDSHA